MSATFDLQSNAGNGVWELQTYSGALAGDALGQATASGALKNFPPLVYALPQFNATLGTPQSWDLRPYWHDADGDACIVGFFPALPAGWSVTQNPSTLHYDGGGAALDIDGYTMWVDDGQGLAGVGWAYSTAAGALSNAINLAGNAQANAAATAALTTQIRLAASALVESLVTGGLLTQVLFSGAQQAQATAAGSLGTGIPLAGGAPAQAGAAGNLTTGIRLGGAAQAQVTLTGDVSGGVQLGGSAAVLSTALATLSTAIQTAGNAVSNALMSGGLLTQILLAAQAQSSSSAAGTLGSGAALGGNANAVTSALASLLTQIQLSGQAQGNAGGAGTLASGAPLVGQAAVAASAVGQLLTGIVLAGGADTNASAAAALTPPVALEVAAGAQVSATGSLGADVWIPEAIIAHLQAMLRDKTTAEGRVYRSREAALQRDETPAIMIGEPEDEFVRRMDEDTDINDLQVEIKLAVRGERYGRQAEVLATKVHALIASDPVIRGLRVFDARKVSAQWEAEDADRVQGVLAVRYRFRYLTRAASLIGAPIH
jgi:hypothetical protein